ncbi:MAG: efflux RND transporter periplasmic adaptor subunit [Verrucomicrobiae bacterium]|nr:efflux RND transporter periplasmic adaptor subunit [Verrucomicrobiae bacterium]
MKPNSFIQSLAQRTRQRPLVAAAAGLVVVLLIALALRPGTDRKAVSYYEVKRGDFLISIVEGGTIEAVNEVVVRNEVEGTARIIYIVPEGTYVKKGDLLVELDSSSTLDSVNQQQINVEKAQFSLIQAQQQLEIQKSTVDSELSAARLKVEFAESDLKKYLDGEAKQNLRNAQIEITNVVESLQINKERLEWTEKLYAKGYETKANLDSHRLAVSQSELRLEQANRALWLLENFEAPKRKRTLESALEEAQEDYERVRLQGERKLAQASADVETQRKTLDLNQAKLDRDKKQLEATKIHAPQDGLVVYSTGGGGGGGGGRFSTESMIEEGAVVRNRQELIKLPDVSEMKLQVKIHESHINQIRPGLPAYVVLDSMPDQRFRGFVARVAPLPDSSSRWGNPNLKVYATEVRITDRLPDVKPGVSARAEVVITNLADVLTVPIQAVTTLRGQQVAYLASNPPRPVPVNVGLYNQRFIEITTGLSEGDRVLLSPPFDTQDKDLGGALMAKGDEMPTVDSNQVSRALAPRNGVERGGPSAAFPRAAANPGTEGLGSERGANVGDAPTARTGESPRAARPEGERGGNFPNREEILKQFDTNGDGELDESERAAMRERFGGGQRRRGTNAPPADAPRPTPDS